MLWGLRITNYVLRSRSVGEDACGVGELGAAAARAAVAIAVAACPVAVARCGCPAACCGVAILGVTLPELAAGNMLEAACAFTAVRLVLPVKVAVGAGRSAVG